MIEASKLKAGMTFETADGKLIRVLEASHHKPGKGNTIMRMKLRDVRTGSTFDTSYRPEEKFEQAIIETVPAQYLYKMDDTAYFMNTETYDQYEIPVVNVENELDFHILENSDVKIQFYGTEVIGVTVPTTVELTVAETQPSIKGATVTGSGKPATMETGLVVNVPDFIEAGQKLVINTAEGTYVSRA
ncbi:TPA: elongation factor P [Streptococcus pneumoniae]|nr:elongation factor P [Streptococcus pneumoniae]